MLFYFSIGPKIFHISGPNNEQNRIYFIDCNDNTSVTIDCWTNESYYKSQMAFHSLHSWLLDVCLCSTWTGRWALQCNLHRVSWTLYAAFRALVKQHSTWEYTAQCSKALHPPYIIQIAAATLHQHLSSSYDDCSSGVVHSWKSWIICLTEVIFLEYLCDFSTGQVRIMLFEICYIYSRYISLLHVPDLKKSTLCQADNTRSEPLLCSYLMCVQYLEFSKLN